MTAASTPQYTAAGFHQYFGSNSNVVIPTPHSGNESAAATKLAKPTKRKEEAAVKNFMAAPMKADSIHTKREGGV